MAKDMLIKKIIGLSANQKEKALANYSINEISEDRLYDLIESEAKGRFDKNRRLTYEERRFVLKYLGKEIREDCDEAYGAYALATSGKITCAGSGIQLLHKALAFANRAYNRANLIDEVYTGDRPRKIWDKIRRLSTRTHNLVKAIEFYLEMPHQHRTALYFENLMYRNANESDSKVQRTDMQGRIRSSGRPWNSSNGLLDKINSVVPGLKAKILEEFPIYGSQWRN